MNTTEILESWLHGKSKRTQDGYLRDVRQAFAWLGTSDLAAIRLKDLQEYQTHLYHDRHFKADTVNRKLSALCSLLQFAYDEEFIERDSTKRFKGIKTHDDISERVLTHEQVKRIIEAASPGRDQAMLRLLYLTMIRASELCDLRWKDFTPEANGWAIVRVIGKGDKERFIRVPAVMWAELQALRADASDDDRVFPLNRHNAHGVLKAAAIQAGCPKASMHWFRHSGATHSLERGCPIAVLRDTLGHSNISTTNKYLHSRPDQSASDFLSL